MSLPSGYKRLEYIQSSGTQYIDTGVKSPKDGLKIELDFEYTAAHDSAALFGSQNYTIPQYSICAYGASPAFWVGTSTKLLPFTTDISHRYKLTVEAASGVLTAALNNTTASTAYTGDLESEQSIYLFANHDASLGVLQQASMKLYACKMYSNGAIARDLIPCKNSSGVNGLWDDVNNTFYSNAGSGTFTTGPEVKGTNKTLIGGTVYDLKSGKCLVGGTAYAAKKGRALIGGTGYDISLLSGTPISELPIGNTVKIAVNGTLRDFLIVHQGLPSYIYDDSCNGTWLLMKDIYENRVWQSGNINKYESSDIHRYLNNTFLNLFDSNIKDAIKQVKIPYRKNGGSGGIDQSGANGLPVKIFLLSGYEVGWTTSDRPNFPVDGAKLDYFTASSGGNSKRVVNFNGSAADWWLRSPSTDYTNFVWYVGSSGGYNIRNAYNSIGIRPALILPSDTLVSDDGTITI